MIIHLPMGLANKYIFYTNSMLDDEFNPGRRTKTQLVFRATAAVRRVDLSHG
jgi:hypothetical protein